MVVMVNQVHLVHLVEIKNMEMMVVLEQMTNEDHLVKVDPEL